MRMVCRPVMEMSLLRLVGETSGEIPVYSLHRIKRLMTQRPIGIHAHLAGVLIRHLSEQNQEYRIETGNDWYCLTSKNLVAAIDRVDDDLEQMIAASVNFTKERAEEAEELLATARQAAVGIIGLIKDWFYVNYDDLLYDMRGTIPWPIILRLRAGLSTWIHQKLSPFGQDIDDFVLEVAKEQDVQTNDAEAAWEQMGGKLAKPSS
jgi:hypothetical protein